MKKEMFFILEILFIIIVICIIIVPYFKSAEITSNDIKKNISGMAENTIKDYDDYTETTMKAIIVKVYEDKKQLLTINSQNTSKLIYVNYTNEENAEFKENQEIAIFYDGIITTTYPEKISNVKKIEIIKENSNITIPDEVLRYCYSSENKVSIEVDKFNVDGIIFTVTDMNKIPYEYLINYEIYQETKNNDYTGNEQMKEATSTSTSSYTRTRF